MTAYGQRECRNHLLQHLTTDDFARVAGSLERIEAEQRDCLSEPGVPASYVYFPETAVVSITSQHDPIRLEIGFVGREGFVGLPVVLSDGISPAATFVQIPGRLLRMPADTFRAAVFDSPTLLATFLRYTQAYLFQVSFTAVANGIYNIEERLARWLLMAADRVDGAEIVLTHDFLAMMLGVRRPGVTVATHVLEGEYAIRAQRGRIVVRNRAKLEAIAGKSYGPAEAEYERLFGPAPAAPERAALPMHPSTDPAPLDAVRDRIHTRGLAGRSVLVVEDDYLLATDTASALRHAGGTVIGPVGREAQALSMARREFADCAVVDLNLGEGIRFDVAAALQDRGIPFVFMTGYEDQLVPARFASVERLLKPVDFVTVVRSTHRLCAADSRAAV